MDPLVSVHWLAEHLGSCSVVLIEEVMLAAHGRRQSANWVHADGESANTIASTLGVNLGVGISDPGRTDRVAPSPPMPRT